ncbi:MAG: hypothetical protein AAFU03_18470, partial [Bacteroidota bacterium]
GRSMCPVERNTQPREGVEIASDISKGFANIDERIVFNVTIRNTQVANEAPGTGYFKNYQLKVPNNKGAILRYDGGLLSESGRLITLETQGPEAEKEGLLTIERNPAAPETVNYDSIAVIVQSQCEASSGSLFFYDGFAGVQLADTLFLSASFHRPCIEAIEVLSPTQDWVVNGENNQKLRFEFQLKNKESSFGLLNLEYAPQGVNVPQVLTVLDGSTTPINAQGNYEVSVDVSGLADGYYQFRLVPQCGLGVEPWRNQTPSEWLAGSIFRTKPTVIDVFPTNNTVMTSGTISASYDRMLDPAGANSLNVSLRGILGGLEYEPTSLILDQATDVLIIPDASVLDLDSTFTIEFWAYP